MKKIISLLLSSLLFISLFQPMVLAKDNDQATKEEIIKYYTWNLAEIYPNKESFDKDYRLIESLLAKIKRYENHISDNFDSFQSTLYLQDSILRRLDKLHTFATLTYHQNTKNTYGLDLKSRADHLLSKVNESLAFVESEIRAMDSTLLDFYLQYPEMTVFNQYIADITDPLYTKLTKDQEKILALASSLRRIPQDIYETYIYQFQFPQADFNQQDLFSRDRNKRKESMKNFYTKRISGLDLLAETLEAQIALTTFNAKAKGFNSALGAAMHKNGLEDTDYLALISRTEQALPLLHKWINFRKDGLGLKENEKLGIYDLHLPIIETENKDPIKYNEGRMMIENSLEPLGTNYSNLLKVAFDNNWIYPIPTENKYRGAYTTNIYDLHPYVLVNYQGSINSVMTLTHELGHAMHFAATNKTQPYATANLSIYTAEVASTTNEILLLEYLLATTKEPEKRIVYVFEYINMIANTFFNQVLAADFEYEAYKAYERGEPIDGDYLNKLWARLQKKYYGNAFEPDLISSSTWADIPHFYNSFYVYQYATGITAGLFFGDAIHKGNKGMTRNYLDFLGSGSSEEPIKLLKNAGINMKNEEPYRLVFDKFETLLSEFEELYNVTQQSFRHTNTGFGH